MKGVWILLTYEECNALVQRRCRFDRRCANAQTGKFCYIYLAFRLRGSFIVRIGLLRQGEENLGAY